MSDDPPPLRWPEWLLWIAVFAIIAFLWMCIVPVIQAS